MDNKELQHWGIKDMKWGQRRFQNKDGSLTPEGRERYRKNKEERPVESTEAKKARILKSRSARELYENADLFTDKELSDAYNRLTLEKNIKSLAPKEVNKGEQFMDTAINWTNKVAKLVEAGTTLYSNMEKVSKLIDGEPEKPKVTKYKDKDLSKVSDKELKSIKDRVQTERDIAKALDEIQKKKFDKDDKK